MNEPIKRPPGRPRLNPARPPVKFLRVRKLTDAENLVRFGLVFCQNQVDKLDRLAAASKVSKSEIIRRAVDSLPEAGVL